MAFENEIEQLTASIWDQVLQMSVEPDPAPLPGGQQTLSACVHITGAWRGAVALSCDTGLATEAAAAMFGSAGPEQTVQDMQDAVGELVNMIGGNLKALLPETCALSLPAVVQGSDYTVRVPGSRLVTKSPFKCGTHSMCVSLMQSVQ
jgi:CheY-specific phosphatase CheX